MIPCQSKGLCAMTIDNVMFPPLARHYFETCFQKVKKSLAFDFEDDTIAREVIDEVLAKDPSNLVDRRREWIGEQSTRERRPCIIVAPGPTLEELFCKFFDTPEVDVSGYFIIAVDGAARRFLEKNKNVDVVVTDLDGLSTEQIIELHDNYSATIIVHGHGNNVNKIQAFFDTISLDERYVFTTQIEATIRVANLGGFTDGDRAIFAAIALGFKRVHLLAMDLDAWQIGPYSKLEYALLSEDELLLSQHPAKAQKIKIALATLKWLTKNKPAECQIVTICKNPPFDFLPNLDGF